MNLDAVLALLRARTGLESESLGAQSVRTAVLSRMQALGFVDAELYAKQLAADAAEFTALIDEVVVPETWFFRGGDLFAFLAEQVRATTRPTFRALSLPCSTGEEPYSLALALAERGCATPVTIDGVDVSPRNLDRARLAVYRELSFRQTPAALRDRYFRPVADGWQLDESLRQRVRFLHGNLLDPQPVAASPPYDLVLCRNLFIYLGPPARRHGLTNLARMLPPGGLLCLGHAEPLDPADVRFEQVGPPGYFLYRRSATSSFVHPAPLRPAAVSPRPPARPAKRPTVVPAVPAAPAAAPPQREQTLDAARRHADRGEYALAQAECLRLLDRSGPHADVYALLGAVQLGQHRWGEARVSLEKALYLVPDHPEALLHLLLLYQQQGEGERAAVLRRRLERGDRTPR